VKAAARIKQQARLAKLEPKADLNLTEASQTEEKVGTETNVKAISTAATEVEKSTETLTPGDEKNELDAKMEVDEDTSEDDNEFDEPIPLKSCLFCQKTFETFGGSLQHMLKVHGFYIPFASQIDDLEGLFGYLGAKVGMGHVCLWCHKSKNSLEAIRAHMSDSNHCKMDPEEDEDIMEFYDVPDDYSSDEEGEEGKVKKGIAGINDAGEIYLHNGKIIGHRRYKKEYAQPVKPLETRESVLVNMIESYRNMELKDETASGEGERRVRSSTIRGQPASQAMTRRYNVRSKGVLTKKRYQRGANVTNRAGYSDMSKKTQQRLAKIHLKVGYEGGYSAYHVDYHSSLM